MTVAQAASTTIQNAICTENTVPVSIESRKEVTFEHIQLPCLQTLLTCQDFRSNRFNIPVSHVNTALCRVPWIDSILAQDLSTRTLYLWPLSTPSLLLGGNLPILKINKLAFVERQKLKTFATNNRKNSIRRESSYRFNLIYLLSLSEMTQNSNMENVNSTSSLLPDVLEIE